MEDVRLVRHVLSAGEGRLLDEQGIDWWSLTFLLIAPQLETMLTLNRVADQIGSQADVWATRSDWSVDAIAFLIGREIKIFSANAFANSIQRVAHYRRLCRRLSVAQIKEIFLDKYDPGYQWRSGFTFGKQNTVRPAILVPSAYGNASRMAALYARMLPDQDFLLVATRQSGKQFEPPSNVRVADLASYATTAPAEGETSGILKAWSRLRKELCHIPQFEVLSRTGVLEEFPKWLQSGLRVRNAWSKVLDRETISAVLCGDDSNVYTRLPVVLASRRKIPSVDFHHGAMDGRYLLKDLPSDVYLAKNAMERDYLLRICGLPSSKVIIAAPCRAYAASHGDRQRSSSIIFFSEPYENVSMRAEEVYREIFPPLCRLARENHRKILLKLHPFESLSERKRMVRALLADQDVKLVTVLDEPLSGGLLSDAWFGLTVESTTVMDCLMHGVPCFLVGWLTLSSFEYARQYARFGVGEVLRGVSEIEQIPARLANWSPQRQQSLWNAADPEMLRQWLNAGPSRQLVARQVS